MSVRGLGTVRLTVTSTLSPTHAYSGVCRICMPEEVMDKSNKFICYSSTSYYVKYLKIPGIFHQLLHIMLEFSDILHNN